VTGWRFWPDAYSSSLRSFPNQCLGLTRLAARSPVPSVLSMTSNNQSPFKVAIVGGGVAALEATLALRDLAGERISTTLLAPEPRFVYRPMRVREPFGYSEAQHYSLDDITNELGVELRQDAFKWLEPDQRLVHTEGGETIKYDALLLAMGAVLRPRFKHAVTIDDRVLDEQLHGLIQDVESGYVHKIAFLAPTPMPWPLPLYELALLTARRAYEMGLEVSITLATPEDAPLAVFGSAVSDTVSRILEDRGITLLTSCQCETPEPGQVAIHPGARQLHVDRVVALPRLFGPSTPGVPKSSHDGFISVDVYGKVAGLQRVYAAGDATNFAIKHGGIAAQQADTAAEAIAALAGAPVEPRRFHPVIRAVLLGADKPLYLSAHVTGGHGSTSEISETPSWSPPTKIAAKYLAPYLDARDRLAAGAR
jgi:sulfide:quinone oxidoreductase